MIICGTGHRPNKLIGGWNSWEREFYKLISIGEAFIEESKPEKVISGMAAGWDLALAQAALNQNVPLMAAVPCKNQETKWNESVQKIYRDILKQSQVSLIQERFDQFCMQQRNIFMVDNSDSVLALWNGSSGGTKNCIMYAKSKNKKIVNLWQVYQELSASEM